MKKVKKITFTTFCELEENVENSDLQSYLQSKLEEAFACYKNEYPGKGCPSNINVLTVEEWKDEYVEGEICPVCGYNGKIKIVGLTDEYVECCCPQCHSKFQIKFDAEC